MWHARNTVIWLYENTVTGGLGKSGIDDIMVIWLPQYGYAGMERR